VEISVIKRKPQSLGYFLHTIQSPTRKLQTVNLAHAKSNAHLPTLVLNKLQTVTSSFLRVQAYF